MNLKIFDIDKNFEVENCRLDNVDNILKELYKRIIIPMYIPVLILISLLLIFKSKENTNYPRYRILIFLIGLSTIIISEMTIRLIREDFFENIKFFIIPIILIISLYTMYLVKFRIVKYNMNTYTQFLIRNYLSSLFNVFFVFFCLIFILNLLTELDFFKKSEVSTLFPLYLSLINTPMFVFEMFPFIFLNNYPIFF